MFEDMTYETIMRTMMEDMPDDIDTSEGRQYDLKKPICFWMGWNEICIQIQRIWIISFEMEMTGAAILTRQPIRNSLRSLTVLSRQDHAGIWMNTITQYSM